MDCVLNAYKSHLYYLGHKPNSTDEIIYKLIKKRTHGTMNIYTNGGIVPLLISSMAWLGHGLTTEIQHTIWSKNHYLVFAKNSQKNTSMKLAIIAGNFGEYVNSITKQPAIYLILDFNHAMFSMEKPKGVPTMAIKLISKKGDVKYYDKSECKCD